MHAEKSALHSGNFVFHFKEELMQVAVSNNMSAILNRVPRRLDNAGMQNHGIQNMRSIVDIKRPTTYVIKKIED